MKIAEKFFFSPVVTSIYGITVIPPFLSIFIVCARLGWEQMKLDIGNIILTEELLNFLKPLFS